MKYKLEIKKIKRVFDINNILIFIASKKIGINSKRTLLKLKKAIKFIREYN